MKYAGLNICRGLKILILAALLTGGISAAGKAQIFGDSEDAAQGSSSYTRNRSAAPGSSTVNRRAPSGNTAANRPAGRACGNAARSNPNLRRNYLTGQDAPATAKSSAQNPNRKFQTLAPTEDGSKRGGIAMGQVIRSRDGNLEVADVSSIFLFYDNFSVRRGLSGDVTCSMRFIVMTTLDRKLNSLSVKLKWPNMETALNFNDVAPNIENYFDYTLVGDGCYSMDKIPNVIVNRCRVARMSQEECAGKIKWLQKFM